MNHDQILYLYNRVFRCYADFYSFVHNYNNLISTLTHILKGSCAKLLAAKYNLRTQSQVYKKFGYFLKSPSGAEFIRPKYGITLKFNEKTGDIIQALYVNAPEKSVASLDNLSCSNCGSEYRVEMHHIRELKDLEPKKDAIDKIMIKINRKQIPLCRKCHMEKHKTNCPRPLAKQGGARQLNLIPKSSTRLGLIKENSKVNNSRI